MSVAEVVIVLGMAVAVYLPKVAPLALASEQLTARLGPWLRYVAPAVLGAFVAPALIAPSGQPAHGFDQLPFLVAFVAALLTRRMVPSLALGLVTIALVALVSR